MQRRMLLIQVAKFDVSIGETSSKIKCRILRMLIMTHVVFDHVHMQSCIKLVHLLRDFSVGKLFCHQRLDRQASVCPASHSVASSMVPGSQVFSQSARWCSLVSGEQRKGCAYGATTKRGGTHTGGCAHTHAAAAAPAGKRQIEHVCL